MIAEDPVEAQVKSSTEQQGVEEDTEDENLLRYSDEVIIHCDLGPVRRITAVDTVRSWRCRSSNHHNEAFILLSFIPVLSSGYDRHLPLHHIAILLDPIYHRDQ